MSSPTRGRSAATAAALLTLLALFAGAAPPEREKLPVRLELVEAHGREGRIRMTVETEPLLDMLLQKGEGRLRAKIFTGSAATRVMNSTADLSVTFDPTIDDWTVELPLRWNSQDTWVAVEVVEARSGARGEGRMDLPRGAESGSLVALSSPAARQTAPLPMTLELYDVRRTPFGSTGRLKLSVPTAPIFEAVPKKTKGHLRVIVLEKTGSGTAIAIPVNSTFPLEAGSEEWSMRLPVEWSETAGLLWVEVRVKETPLRGTGSIRVNQAE
jgi:hypothetical protein